MVQRRDMDEGKDRTPAQAWADYRSAFHRELVDAVQAGRLREGIHLKDEVSHGG